MIYLYWYLGIGMAVLAVVYASRHLTKDKAMESLQERVASFDPDRKKLSYRILNNIVGPILAVIFVVPLWPVVVYMKVKLMLSKKGGDKSLEETEFAVDRQHLQERLTVVEIENREVVTDPLGAVPELPFGHLNDAWKDFLKNHTDSEDLWSFSALWRSKWGTQEMLSGYVIIDNGTPGAYFLTIRKDIPQEADKVVDRADFGGIPGWLRRHAD